MLPYLKAVQNPSKKYSVAFKGLNYGEGTQDGEFAETYNLSTDNYPCITQRAERIKASEYIKPSTLHSKGKLLVIDERDDGFADVYYGDEKVGEVTAGKKQTATVGNYIVIFPDKKYYKVPTEDEEGKFGSMEEEYKATWHKFTASAISIEKEHKEHWLKFTPNSISIEQTLKSTNLYIASTRINHANETKIFNFKVGDIINITGFSNESYNRYNVTITEATEKYIVFSGGGIPLDKTYSGELTITRVIKDGFPFKAGEVVTITDCSKTDNNKTDITITEATSDTLTFEDSLFVETTEKGEITITRKLTDAFPFKKGDAVTISGCSTSENNKESELLIRGVTDDTLTFDDNAFTEATEYGEITISRTVPDLDFICESNYRLWGTHGNTIYSSKYSDPFNFKVFDGLSSDSYSIDVASEGDFTGCTPYSSYICFFKENTLHKLYGTKPSNFQITTANVYGVQKGSEKSMQIVNEMLLYKGVGGVYAFTGGVPELISDKFGNNRYSEAVACCDGEKYYISMKQGDKWNMFTYDISKNIWLREDDTHAVDMAFYDGKVYYLDAKGELYYIDKEADRNNIEWGATFCKMHETMNERKGYSKFHLRMDLSAGAWLAVDIKTDNDLQWKQIYTTHNEKAKTVSIPIIPTRCDSIDIRLRGKGKCTVKAFIREFTVGSDV